MQKKDHFYFIILLWFITVAVAQKFKWATHTSLNSITSSANGPFIVDVNTNNTIQIGWIAVRSGTVIKVADSVNITPRGSAGVILPIYALSPDGALLWSNYLESTSSITISPMEIDSDNRTIHLVGTSSGTLYVGAEQLNSASGVFWIKMNADTGSIISFTAMVVSSNFGVLKICMDPLKTHLFITGNVFNGIYSFLGTSITCPANGGTDCFFIIKARISDVSLVWYKYGYPSPTGLMKPMVHDMKIIGLNLYVSFYKNKQCLYDSTTLLPIGISVLKMDLNGNILDQYTITGTNGYAYINSIPSLNQIIISNYGYDTIQFSNVTLAGTRGSSIMIRLDMNFKLINFLNLTDISPGYVSLLQTLVDSNANVYLLGKYQRSITVAGQRYFSQSPYDYDMFNLKIRPDNTVHWNKVPQSLYPSFGAISDVAGQIIGNSPFSKMVLFFDAYGYGLKYDDITVPASGFVLSTAYFEEGCFDKLPNEVGVCSGFGTCVAPNECNCTSGYMGNTCENWNCFGVTRSSASACSGNGNCTQIDTCNCLPGFSGNKCQSWSCYGVDSQSLEVCSAQGTCNSHDKCSCKAGRIGLMCEGWKCGAFSNTDVRACNGNGNCTATDTCVCRTGTGTFCSSTSSGITSTHSWMCLFTILSLLCLIFE